MFEFLIKLKIVIDKDDAWMATEYEKCLKSCEKDEGWLSKWNHDADIQGSLKNLHKKLEIYKKLTDDNVKFEEKDKLEDELIQLKDDKGLLDTIHDDMENNKI